MAVAAVDKFEEITKGSATASRSETLVLF